MKKVLFILALSLVFILQQDSIAQSLELKSGSSHTFSGQLDQRGQASVYFTGRVGLPVTVTLVTKNKRLRFGMWALHGSFQTANRRTWNGRLPEDAPYGITITGARFSLYKVVISAK